MTQYLVQWTIYAQRVVEAEDEDDAINIALKRGPDPEGSTLDDTSPPEARVIA